MRLASDLLLRESSKSMSFKSASSKHISRYGSSYPKNQSSASHICRRDGHLLQASSGSPDSPLVCTNTKFCQRESWLCMPTLIDQGARRHSSYLQIFNRQWPDRVRAIALVDCSCCCQITSAHLACCECLENMPKSPLVSQKSVCCHIFCWFLLIHLLVARSASQQAVAAGPQTANLGKCCILYLHHTTVKAMCVNQVLGLKLRHICFVEKEAFLADKRRGTSVASVISNSATTAPQVCSVAVSQTALSHQCRLTQANLCSLCSLCPMLCA